MRVGGWIVANLLITGPAAVAWLLERHAGEVYYRAIQEDHWLEWSTVWAFLAAALIAVLVAIRQRRAGIRLPWFACGFALFGFLVAMEEISWGQRLFEFSPPEYFLAENFQQELNLHNVIPSGLRQLGFQLVVIGYGIALPLALALPAVGRLASRLAIPGPPLPLLPAFALIAVFYAAYPLEFTGEWAELMLGLAMATAIATARSPAARPAIAAPATGALAVTAAALTLGFLTLQISGLSSARSETSRRAAEVEIRALRSDFAHERVRTRCGVHKRVYTFRAEYGQTYLSAGRFAGLVAGGLDDRRARFFLDPWNMPYWVRHQCADGREAVFVYSFGPNRRRDSSPWEIRGDDIGAYVAAER